MIGREHLVFNFSTSIFKSEIDKKKYLFRINKGWDDSEFIRFVSILIQYAGLIFFYLIHLNKAQSQYFSF